MPQRFLDRRSPDHVHLFFENADFRGGRAVAPYQECSRPEEDDRASERDAPELAAILGRLLKKVAKVLESFLTVPSRLCRHGSLNAMRVRRFSRTIATDN